MRCATSCAQRDSRRSKYYPSRRASAFTRFEHLERPRNRTLQIWSRFPGEMGFLEPFEVQFAFCLQVKKTCGRETVFFSIGRGGNISLRGIPRGVKGDWNALCLEFSNGFGYFLLHGSSLTRRNEIAC